MRASHRDPCGGLGKLRDCTTSSGGPVLAYGRRRAEAPAALLDPFGLSASGMPGAAPRGLGDRTW